MYWQNSLLNEYNDVRKFQLDVFSDIAFKRNCAKNQPITFTKYDRLLIIMEGRVKISIANENGVEKILYILSDGDLIGEIDFFNKINHDYEVIPLVDTVIGVLERKDVMAKIEANPIIYEHIIKSIIRKYQITSSQLTDNVFMDSDGKIASVLLRIAEQEGETVGEHVEYFYLKHQDIADLLGCSRVTVSRAINKFKCEGIINVKDHKMMILDKEKLEKKYIERL
ncbi:MAG: Crp/Fnr family transcriptional regulator [Clostridia bacterium]|nr:Crp/Fnr family transcriptional regulator [Clostridia bacterium]